MPNLTPIAGAAQCRLGSQSRHSPSRNA
jgi:hypothetical protein